MPVSKIDKTQLFYSITFLRFYLSLPSDVGLPSAYSERLVQIAANLLNPEIFFSGLTIEAHDMDDELLDEEVKRGQANLQNVYAGTAAKPQPGYGLYHRGLKKLQLAVFHDGWVPDVQPSAKPIQPHNIVSALDTLAHELGHHLSQLIGFNVSNVFSSKEITRIILPLLTGQASSPEENFAEHFRFLFGCNKTINTFSDGKTSGADMSKLRIAMRTCLALHTHLLTKAFSDLRFDGACWTWNQHIIETRWFLFIPYVYTATTRHQINLLGVISQI